MFDVELASEKVRPLKRSEYDQLIALGVFDDEKVELLYGMVVPVSPQKAAHAAVVARLTRLLVRKLSDRATVRIQAPLALLEHSEPEPDVAIVPLGDYADEHPIMAYLVIEVADTSMRKDREIKAVLYAQAKIPEYWIVNLIDRVVEVYRSPVQGKYESTTTFGPEASLSPLAFADFTLPVKDILPTK